MKFIKQLVCAVALLSVTGSGSLMAQSESSGSAVDGVKTSVTKVTETDAQNVPYVPILIGVAVIAGLALLIAATRGGSSDRVVEKHYHK
ncbi:MAG: hypothetical protein SGI71_07020 [Verrucomicrobiota bacterium]|nr:hypothetical protein [Verrucomicrobiota bacterium]